MVSSGRSGARLEGWCGKRRKRSESGSIDPVPGEVSRRRRGVGETIGMVRPGCPGPPRFGRGASLRGLRSRETIRTFRRKNRTGRRDLHPLRHAHNVKCRLIHHGQCLSGKWDPRQATRLLPRFKRPLHRLNASGSGGAGVWKGSPAWIRTTISRINNPVDYHYPTGE